MEKIKWSLFLLFFFLCLISSCKNESANEPPYQCPMKCEGEKEYIKEGSCPVCKMDLKSIATSVSKVKLSDDETLETSI